MEETDGANRLRLFTVGHSNHSRELFLDILAAYGIRSLIDVRSYPTSSRYAQFDQLTLEGTLSAVGITYHWFQDLGGWRRGLGDRSPNKGLPEGGFRNYADYMLTEAFRTAVGRVQGIARIRTTTVMCAEKDVTRCHRYYLSDYLVSKEVEVWHILDENKSIQHVLSKHVVLTEDQSLVYPSHPKSGQTLLFEP